MSLDAAMRTWDIPYARQGLGEPLAFQDGGERSWDRAVFSASSDACGSLKPGPRASVATGGSEAQGLALPFPSPFGGDQFVTTINQTECLAGILSLMCLDLGGTQGEGDCMLVYTGTTCFLLNLGGAESRASGTVGLPSSRGTCSSH